MLRAPLEQTSSGHSACLSAPIFLMLVQCILALLPTGCSSRESSRSESDRAAAASTEQAEPSFEAQLARVQQGKSDEIRLQQSAITKSELEQLKSLRGLRTLVLDGGVVNDDEIDYLVDLEDLVHLRLRESPLTDSALERLAQGKLNHLVILNIPQAHVTVQGLRSLGRLPALRQLRIAGKQIDDQCVEVLSQWPALTSLHLIGPQLTDRSLQIISNMKELGSFYLDDCQLSDRAWEQLFKERPQLHVHIDQAHHDRDPTRQSH